MPQTILPKNLKQYRSSLSRVEWVPLGTNCDVAHFLRQHGLRKSAYPFDWIVSPLASSVALIESEFADFLKEENLVFLGQTERFLFDEEDGTLKTSNEIITPVVCKKYSLLFPHDFSAKAYFDLATIKEKYRKRIERLYRLFVSGKHIVFVSNIAPLNKWQAEQYRAALNEVIVIDTEAAWQKHLTRFLDRAFPQMSYGFVGLPMLRRKTIGPIGNARDVLKKFYKIFG